jgi:hypothetical protein
MAKGDGLMTVVTVTPSQIAETLGHLRDAGLRGTECVVLWLTNDDDGSIAVERVYRPEQFARADVFRIPSASMREMFHLLSKEGLRICGQVHSHPLEAFHSRADDKWAIVRHENALSLVVPYFARRTETRTFLDHTKIYRLDPRNRWIEAKGTEIGRWLRIA